MAYYQNQIDFNKYLIDPNQPQKGYYDQSPQMAMPQPTQLKTSAPAQGGSGIDYGQVGMSGASGAAAGGPVGAAIAAGGSLATQIIAQRAADERAKRERAAQIAQDYGQNQQNAYNTILQSLGKAYR